MNNLQPIPGSPRMSLSRTPSPHDFQSVPTPDPIPSSSTRQNRPAREVTWAAAQARSAKASSRSQGGQFRAKLVRTLSSSLPTFNAPAVKDHPDWAQLSRPRKGLLLLQRLLILIARLAWRLRLPLAVLAGFIICTIIFYATPLHFKYKRNLYMGGGKKFVLILGANPGGGVLDWKGPREWAIERYSVTNKRNYAARWGYALEIVDMATKKRYAHEWREGWEKADTIRRCMNDYPDAEWFWWLDLNTFIMEPSISLQKQLFNDLTQNTYRDINQYNPLRIQHPPPHNYLDEVSRSAVGDGRAESLNLLLPQDCSGFTLGSFFIRRSNWTDRLLDMLWDPVHYEQKHMQWEHKEQDALEYLYTAHPWIRASVGFVPQRKIASFPSGACGVDNSAIHYSQKDRDFMVSLAGCEWGRDCWAEIYSFRQLSNRLNRNPWEKFKDGISDGFRWFVGLFKKKSDGDKARDNTGKVVEVPKQDDDKKA